MEKELTYRNIACKKMTEEEIEATSKLYSENYGVWSAASSKCGSQVKMSVQRIKKSFIDKADRFVSMVFHDGELIGHAFYMRRNINKVGMITWILQLVVKKGYRGQQIGAKLMHSIWGLSDSFACGLYTANPMTIKALETATFRHVDVARINKNIDKIRLAAKDVLDDMDWIMDYKNGMVNTKFYVDHSDIQAQINMCYDEAHRFPFDANLLEGYEWLAFTFKSQTPYIETEDQLQILMEYSNDIIIDAYSKMNLAKQKWTKHTDEEVEYFQKWINTGDRVLDIGCGQGRHSIALAKAGYSVVGIDFSNENIDAAKRNNTTDAVFLHADARKYRSKQKYDVIICMYDVIGSFPNESDNYALLKTARKMLKRGGRLLLSVMNMKLTFERCKKKSNIVNNINEGIRELLMLSATNTMQSTGDVFDGASIIIDESTGICYRKEQFFADDELPKMYVVRDRRYSFRGISKLVEKAGFDVEEKYYFNARCIRTPLNADNRDAKEIFLVARKKRSFSRIFVSIDDAWK